MKASRTIRRSETVACGLLLVLAAVLAYRNSLGGPFILDDRPHILENLGIRRLWPPVWLGHTTRPLVGLTLAINYAIGGLGVSGYHLFNLALHAAVAVVLFLLVRATLERPGHSPAPGRRATALALITSALWVVHPLNTEAVTYVIQRGEALAAGFTLLMLYGLARLAASERKRPWSAFVWTCCALGVASKPVMAIAPVLAVAYDRTFLADSWRSWWRERGALHVTLFGTLLLLPLLLASDPSEWTTSAGFSGSGVDPLRYAAAQPLAIARYLKLSFWPADLCLDYGWPGPSSPAGLASAVALVVAILFITMRLAWRGHRAGFVGLAFLGPLAPTSSFIPIADPVVEHRMYLPLAALVLATVLAVEASLRRARPLTPRVGAGIALGLALVAGIALAGRTLARNDDYASEVAIWSETVARRPREARPHGNLGAALLAAGRTDEAIGELEAALRLDPGFVPARVSLGRVFYRRGDFVRSRAHFEAALRGDLDNLEARTHLGIRYLRDGRLADAEAQFREVVRRNPPDPEPYRGLGLALVGLGRVREATVELNRAIVRRPRDVGARIDLADAYARLGWWDRARREFEAVLRLDRGNAAARAALARLERGEAR